MPHQTGHSGRPPSPDMKARRKTLLLGWPALALVAAVFALVGAGSLARS